MGKGQLKVKKLKSGPTVTFDPRLSSDRKTFVLRVETSGPMYYQEHLLCILAWAQQELDEMRREPQQSLN